MSLNLHGAVRQVIPAINSDITGYWYRSKGWVPSAGGRQQPAYNLPLTVQCQVQPPSGRDLRFIDFLQLQGVIRSVWMFSDPQTIVRVNQTGNDLLMFPQWTGAPNDVWMVATMPESWAVVDGGWSKVYVTLQTDRAYSIYDSNGQLVLDSNGIIVTQS
ncbi:MAG: hypothetical protein M0Z85_03520 [Gammaproteobacteria bacterium]|nr:hypothetical protein [Gammaproteobacteria bacterium]